MSFTSKASDVLNISLYATLKGEHHEVDAMLKTLKTSGDKMDGVRERVVDKLRKELLSHAHAEQEAVYSVLREKTEKKNLVTEAEAEHNKMEHLVKKLSDAEPDSSTWHETLDALIEEVHHHVEEEEGEMFDEMRNVFSDEDEKRIVEHFREEKEWYLKEKEGR